MSSQQTKKGRRPKLIAFNVRQQQTSTTTTTKSTTTKSSILSTSSNSKSTADNNTTGIDEFHHVKTKIFRLQHSQTDSS